MVQMVKPKFGSCGPATAEFRIMVWFVSSIVRIKKKAKAA